MFEVSIQNTSLTFISDSTQVDTKAPVNLWQIHFADEVLKVIETLEQSKDETPEHYYLLCDDVRQSWLEFISHYKWIVAAGGLVMNDKNEFLLIHRLGRWDLPKGKIESGESPREAAVREVTEECGIHPLQIVRELKATYHTYELKGQRMLKMTHWYRMQYHGDETLKPQTEEGITDIRWMDFQTASKALEDSYPAIRKVFSGS